MSEKLRDALEALGEYGCEFINLEIDCPERNSERLGRECGCDDIIWSRDKETNCWTISCSTQTGISDIYLYKCLIK
jgi:hypothetical protein